MANEEMPARIKPSYEKPTQTEMIKEKPNRTDVTTDYHNGYLGDNDDDSDHLFEQFDYEELMKLLVMDTYQAIEKEMDAIAPLTDEEDVVGLRLLMMTISDHLKRHHFDRFKLRILMHILRKLPTTMADGFAASLEMEEELPNKKALLLLRHYLGNHLIDLYVRPAETRQRAVLTVEERHRLLDIVRAEVTPLLDVANQRDVAAIEPLLTVIARARLLVRPYGPVEGAALENAFFDAVWNKLPEDVRQVHLKSAVKLAAYGHKSLAPLNRTLTTLLREGRQEQGALAQERLLRELIGRAVAEKQQKVKPQRNDFSTSAPVTPAPKITTTPSQQQYFSCSDSSSASPSSSQTPASSSTLYRSRFFFPTTTTTPTNSPYSTAPSSSDESIHSTSSKLPLSLSSASSAPSSPSANRFRTTSSYSSDLLSNGPLRYRFCTYCKTLGHHTFDCELPKAMLCFNCFEVGHKAKYCTVQQLRVGNPYFESIFSTTSTSTTTRLPVSSPSFTPISTSTPLPSSARASPSPPRLVRLVDGQLFGPRSGNLNFCLECVQFGHRASTCTRALCFNCHNTGHMSSHCPVAVGHRRDHH